MLNEFSKIISKADRIVAHYGDKFDQPFINTRLITNKSTPYQWPKSIDTYKLAKKYFKFQANRLGYLGRLFGFGGKNPMEAKDWVGVCEGDFESLKKMEMYNLQDVYLLEAVYKRMLPYVTTNLDFNKLSTKVGKGNICSSCGSDHINKAGRKVLTSKICQAFKCMSCGHYFYDQNMLYTQSN